MSEPVPAPTISTRLSGLSTARSYGRPYTGSIFSRSSMSRTFWCGMPLTWMRVNSWGVPTLNVSVFTL